MPRVVANILLLMSARVILPLILPPSFMLLCSSNNLLGASAQVTACNGYVSLRFTLLRLAVFSLLPPRICTLWILGRRAKCLDEGLFPSSSGPLYPGGKSPYSRSCFRSRPSLPLSIGNLTSFWTFLRTFSSLESRMLISDDSKG